jgi:conjugative relaxase-like TrwC/TraI family protein
MLDISKPLTSGKVQSYYRSEYSAASNSYFTEGGSLRGQWHGQLAAELGLSGEVTAEAFDRLSEGQHPQTGEQLIAHRDTIKQANGEELGHRAGWDLTFNAPKTVSLTALVGGDERVREAHCHAVQVALTELEKYAQARMGGNHAAETTGKWIVATFDHDTARPVDGYPAPHLHTHAVLFNLTEDATGQARSLQPYELFKIQSMATAVYQNQLEYDLRALCYGIERGTNHAPDIRGYSAEYLTAESLRNAEIKQGMVDRGVTGREAESLAAHQTRDEKLKLTPDELRALHQAKAEAFGNQPRQVVAAAELTERQEPNREKEAIRAGKSVAHARERLTERSAAIEHFEVVRDALRRAQGKAQLRDIQAAIKAEREQGQLLTVHHIRPNAPAWRYTTPELIGIERSAIRTMQEGQGKLDPIARLSEESIGERFSHLNRDQRQLVYQTLNTPDQVFGVQGGAGTGKTTALEPIREVAVEHGYVTLGLAATSGAVKALRNSGLEAETLQSFLLQPSSGEAGKPYLYFVDESSLASGKQIEGFLARLQPADRVLLIGDTRQHQSVEAGRIFAELQDAGMHTASLNEIVRQKNEDVKKAVEAMAAGRIAEGVELLREQGRIHTIEHRAERFAAIAAAYAEAPAGTLIVSPDNQSRAEINAAVRNQLRQFEQLGETEYRASVLANRQDVTAADRAVAHSYHVGDSVQYLRGSKQLGLPAKSYAQVTAVDSEHNQITVETANGKSVTYDPARLTGVALYEPQERTFAIGERVQFTTPWKDQGISNREMGTVTHLESNGNIRVSLDGSHRTVGWNLRTYQHLDYAYAMTSHAAQGQTVDRVLIQIDTGDSRVRSLVDQSLAYVATSRPRHDAQIFTDNAEALSQALSRRNENATALNPEQIGRYAQTAKQENVNMPGVVADYVREQREEENTQALETLRSALEESYWPSEQELAQALASEIEELRKEIEQLVAQDLRELQERYPGQNPAELLESYHREQAALAQEEQTAMREAQPEERITLVSEGEWQSDFNGLWEHRVSIGKSPEGFHYDIESSYQGGEPSTLGWSTQAYPNPQAAETAAQPAVNAFIGNGEAEEQEHGYSEGLSI